MNSRDLARYRSALRLQKMRVYGVLATLAAALALLWAAGGALLPPLEKQLYDTVAASQAELWRTKDALRMNDPQTDPHRTGLIGVEWSPVSTTLGSLAAKRTACDPRWSTVVSRWLDKLGVERGDTVAVLSSSSFPGMILNVLVALEARGADIFMILSLGSSTWGANDPRMQWPKSAAILRKAGLLHTKQKYITLGGGRENGGGISEEGLAIMRKIAETENTPLVVKDSLEEIIAWKMGLIIDINPKVVINIGGAHSSLGNSDAVTRLAPGLHRTPNKNAGDGLISMLLDAGYPVIHLLNMKELCAKSGVPFDAEPSPLMGGTKSLVCAAAGLALFTLVAVFFRRWEIME